MAEDENSWVFDSLVCFLKGPIWDAPIQNFIEEKSLIFEPNNVDNEEDYQKIFEEYKNLVDFMLGNFMEDIGITSAQFEYACSKSRQHHSLRFDQSTFEQIWAANNYEMFKRMMTQRNVELQLQALELIERKYGILPQSFVPTKKEADVHVENRPEDVQTESDETKEMERVVLHEVAKIFVEEEPSAAPEMKALLEEKEILESTRDQISSEMPKTQVEVVMPQEEKEIVVEDTKQIEKGELQKKNVEATSVATTADVVPKSAPKTDIYENKPSVVKQIDQLELKKRQEYLRKQRDKLVALKKEERKKQFGKAENENIIKKTRPKSAKAAEAVLTGDQTSIGSQELQFRKALAERLKIEVVDKNRK